MDFVIHYERTRNREDIIKMRDDYLNRIQKYREEGLRVYYRDENCIFKNMTCAELWRKSSAYLLIIALSYSLEDDSVLYCHT